ncbi:MAG: hypothetical protein ACLVJO_03910 [[Clostridium] scindens]
MRSPGGQRHRTDHRLHPHMGSLVEVRAAKVMEHTGVWLCRIVAMYWRRRIISDYGKYLERLSISI